MVFVVVYHSSTIEFDIIENQSLKIYINYILRSILSTCVPLFFFSNGFLLINKKFDLNKHIIKMIRLIVLTCVWGIINLLFLMPIEGEWLSIKEFINALWNWRQGWINHLWYMGALICVYIFYPLIRNVYDHNRIVFNYWLAISIVFTIGNVFLCMGSTLMYYLLFQRKIYFFSNIFNMFNPFRKIYGHAFAYFSLGCFVGGRHQETLKKFEGTFLFNRFYLLIILLVNTLLLGIWGMFCSKLLGSMWDVVWNGYDTLFTAINVLAIYLISNHYKYNESIISYCIQEISKNTLGIYFIHEIFLHLFVKIGIRSFAFANSWLFDFFYAFCIVALCLFAVTLMKKIPIIKKLVT